MADPQSPGPINDDSGYELPEFDRPASSSPPLPALHAEMPGGSARSHDPYAALRLRDYRLYSMGWIMSVMAQQIQEVAVGWDIFTRTRAEARIEPMLALGLIGLTMALPLIALAIPAGALADRFDRRKIIILSMIGAASASCWLAWLSHTHGALPLMYLCLLLGASASAIGWPARSALLTQIVPAEAFANAAMWNSSVFQVASMVGPAIGGLILYWSVSAAYVVAAAFLLGFAACLIVLDVKPPLRSREPVTLASLAAGVRFVFGARIILATITLDLFAVLFGGATALLPVFAKDILHVSSGGFGILRAAPAVGALLMAVCLAHLPPMKNAGRDMLLAVTGFGLATIVFGLSKNFALSFFMLLLTGVFDNVSVVVRHTLVQMLTPDEMRGRVSAVNNIFVGASNELGGFESGLTGAWLGPIKSVVLGGFGAIAVVAIVALAWPQVGRFGSLEDARPIEEPGKPRKPTQ